MFYEFSDGFGVAEFSAVFTPSRHRVVSVSDGNDPGLDRNLSARGPARIALSVDPLVMIEDIFGDGGIFSGGTERR
jgi:hypothetical protein